jgi:hypothetical protein
MEIITLYKKALKNKNKKYFGGIQKWQILES